MEKTVDTFQLYAEKVKDTANLEIESDEEFFFWIGQLAQAITKLDQKRLPNPNNKNRIANDLTLAKTEQDLRDVLTRNFHIYSHYMEPNTPLAHVWGKILSLRDVNMAYKHKNDDITASYLDKSLLNEYILD